MDYWKSTRKIIATSRAVYEKLVGKSAVEEIEAVDDDVAIVEPPTKKARVAQVDVEKSVAPVLEKLEEVEKAVKDVNKKLDFVEEMRKSFECVICRLPCKLPVVSRCCQRIVGCTVCVKRWSEANSRCPLCTVETSTASYFALKGIDPITGLFRIGDDRETSQGSIIIDTDTATATTSDDSSNEFPPFRVANTS